MAEKPLRILQILRAPVGGLFRHVNDLTQALSARGHEIGIAVDSLAADDLTAGRLEKLRPFARLGVHMLPMPRVVGIGDLTTPRAVRKLAREHGIDMLHGHGAKGGLYARLGRGEGRAAIYTTHGGVLHFSPTSPSGILFQTFERLLLPATDAIIFESQFAKNAFYRLIGRPKCPDPVIHNGLVPAEFEPVTPGPGAADFVFIGEFRELKGIHYLLEALVPLKRLDGTPATMVMAGGGPDFERFRGEIAAFGLVDRVTLLGVQPARTVLPKGRIAVVPSLKESLPYVVMEAAAAGLPVIATNVGGIGEIFGPTATSLVPAADALALSKAMRAALADPDMAREEAARRLDFVRSEFSVDHMTDAVERVYHEALGRR